MEDKGKSLSIRIMELLKPILPEGTGFIMISGTVNDEDIGITSNLPDDVALEFLQAAATSIMTEPAIDLEKEVN